MFLVIKSEVNGIDANIAIESRDATFFEEIFPMKDKLPLTPEPRPSKEQSPPKEGGKPVKLIRSKRLRREPNLREGFIT